MKKESLQVNEQVLYYDGQTLMDITRVRAIEEDRAFLENGVICKPEAKKGSFPRADYRAKSFRGFIKKLDEETQAIYKAWVIKQNFRSRLHNLEARINQRICNTVADNQALANGEDPALADYISRVDHCLKNMERKLS